MGEDVRDGSLDKGNLTAILDRLSGLPPTAVIQVDREIRYKAHFFEYEQVTFLGHLNAILGRTPGRLLERNGDLAYIFACHGNGYLREAALNRVGGPIPSAFLFALLACQLNNWVPQVREAAGKCLRRVMPVTDAGIVAEAAMYLLQYRDFWQRGVTEVGILDTVLTEPALREALMHRVMTSRAGAPNRTLVAVLRHIEVDTYLPALMTKAAHPEVRAIAAKALVSGIARWPKGRDRAWIDKSMGSYRIVTVFDARPVERTGDVEVFIAQAARDPSVQVRKVAMQALIDASGMWERRSELIERMAGDRSSAIRAGIGYILRHRCGQP
ncbi:MULTISPECIES: hypothetical protein [Asticcacaulis]|uniref:hypothetical protein n=1 Tax=Asticcacaulis TaxID=76890 RepID=UPI001AE48346|nr:MULTISPECIES: hypothetical protein [Asticcacaulis]MBP2158321.1 hypothetical protein [Asticcacaulis solisilvae]MDR6799366.1 hypothetical protein [Asticcacaulis sp. BE141]